MKKYGLQLRFPPDQQKKMASKPPIRPPTSIFGDDDDDDDDDDDRISCQPSKSKSLRMMDEHQKKTLEEDPMAFDYDGVYDEMKSSAARARVQDQSKREPKYIGAIIESVKKREREHDVIYERKLLKERSKEDHIYEDKEKFVTSAYKQKLAERAKWLEEERLRGLREEKDDVTKKSDLTDFYFSLGKNVAFGARSAHASKPVKEQPSISIAAGPAVRDKPAGEKADEESPESTAHAASSDPVFKIPKDEIKATSSDVVDGKQNSGFRELWKEASEDKKVEADRATGSRMDYKRSEDAVAAARERFLARKKAREQL